MKLALLSHFLLITLVAGSGAWKQNKEYKYKVLTKTLNASSKLNNRWIGTVLRARLIINPQSENLLVGKIEDAEYAEIQLSQKWNADFNDDQLSYNKRQLNRPFEIHLENGAIHSLSVDRKMTKCQKIQLKAIVSQLQVNTTNFERDGNNAFYKTTEQTVTGNCETTYDISAMPDYLVESNSNLIPLPELKGDGEIINVVKTRDHSKCDERFGLMNERNENRMDKNVVHTEDSRIFLSGSLQDYTIQSSDTTNKVIFNDAASFTTVHYVHLKLESMKESNTRRSQNQIGSNLKVEKLSLYDDFEEDSYNSNERIVSSNEQIIRSSGQLTKGMPRAMKINKEILLPMVLPFFIFSIQSCSSQDVVNGNDYIKNHAMDITNITNIIHAFNDIIYPAKTDSPFEPPVVCIVSENELEEIWNLIEEEESSEIGHEIHFTYSTNCTELEKIKTAILKMKHDFKELLKQQISSVKYEEMKAAYENEIKLLQKRLDDEKATSDEEHKEIVGELQDKIHDMQDQVNELLKKLEEEQNAKNEAYIRLCIANIDRNEFDEAIDVFKNITNYKEIKRIVADTYRTIPDSYEKIILFLRKLDYPEAVVIGYTSLLEELTNLNQLRDMRILILRNELQAKPNPIYKELTNNVIEITERDIQINDFQGFVDYLNTHGESRDEDFVKPVAIMVVEMIYYKFPVPCNAHFLLSLVPKLSHLHHKLVIINELITQVKVAGHTTKNYIFSIISKAVEVRNASKESNDNHVKDLIAQVENNLPEYLQALMTTDVCIKNAQTGEYLFSKDDYDSFPYDWKFPMTSKFSKNSYYKDWISHIIYFINNGNTVHIFSNKHNNNMSYYNNVFETDAYFDINIVSEGKFTIKNLRHGYLYPSDHAFETVFGPEYPLVHKIYCREEEPTLNSDAIWLIEKC